MLCGITIFIDWATRSANIEIHSLELTMFDVVSAYLHSFPGQQIACTMDKHCSHSERCSLGCGTGKMVEREREGEG